MTRMIGLRFLVIVNLLAFLAPVVSVGNAQHPPDDKPSKGIRRETDPGRLMGRRDKWAILIGVNNYTYFNSLKYCVADVRLLESVLVQRCGFPKDNILVLADDQPKAQFKPEGSNFHVQIRGWLMQLKANDTVLVFFSGHGFLDARGQSFLAPRGCSRANPMLTGFRAADLRELLLQCKAKQKLLILDCCHAGAGKGASNGDVGAAFSDAEGLVTLASCSANQESYEWDAKQHGFFTYFLAEGLKGRADDNHDGIVDSGELHQYVQRAVRKRVQKELGKIQTPYRTAAGTGEFELARIDQGRQAESPREIVNSIGMQLQWIPSGDFVMGTPESADGQSDERPQHKVRISRPFYLGRHEVTVGAFRQFVESTRYETDAERGSGAFFIDPQTHEYRMASDVTWRRPGFPQQDSASVVCVSWNDAIAFCRWLSQEESQHYRLPTEAEWEYACRAGSRTAWCYGAAVDDLDGYARFGKAIRVEYDSPPTAAAGVTRSNAFGLFNMHGNVSEWCQDRYTSGYYQRSQTDDPQGPVSGLNHVYRGGSWSDRAEDTRSAKRFFRPGNQASFDIGFRIAREIR